MAGPQRAASIRLLDMKQQEDVSLWLDQYSERPVLSSVRHWGASRTILGASSLGNPDLTQLQDTELMALRFVATCILKLRLGDDTFYSKI